MLNFVYGPGPWPLAQSAHQRPSTTVRVRESGHHRPAARRVLKHSRSAQRRQPAMLGLRMLAAAMANPLLAGGVPLPGVACQAAGLSRPAVVALLRLLLPGPLWLLLCCRHNLLILHANLLPVVMLLLPLLFIHPLTQLLLQVLLMLAPAALHTHFIPQRLKCS